MKNKIDQYTDTDDEKLFALIEQGDEGAFTQAYERYHKLLYVLAYRYLMSSDMAEDVVQHVFSRLWEFRSELRVGISLKNYLFTMTKNHVLNLIRNENSAIAKNYEMAQAASPYEDNLIEKLEKKELMSSFYKAVDMLPAQKRDICLMKVQEELTNQEIAERMNLSVNTIKTHYSEALKLLRIHLSKMLIIVAFTTPFNKVIKMNRPTDKQIEEVLAGIASPEDAKYVAEWFATEEGSDYLEAAMTQDSELIKNEFADLYVDHDIPSKKILEQIRKNIRIKKLKRICFRVAAVLIPVVLIVGLYMQLNSKVDLFGTSEYEEVVVDKGERIQIMFQDGTKVYINSDSKLRYPKKFALNTREVYLEGEAYFVVAKNKNRPFIVNLSGPAIHVLGTSFNVQDYPENKDIVVCLDEGNINLTLPTEKKYPVQPGERLVYNKDNQQCTISKMNDMQRLSMWKQNVIVFKDTPLPEVIKILNRWYNVNFKIEDEQASKYVYTLTSDNTILEKVLQDLEKIAPVKFEYDEVRKEVTVRMKQDGKK